jgi:hypothetical protein
MTVPARAPRRRILVPWLAALLWGPSALLPAQQPASVGDSPAQDLITRAKEALNNLNYDVANTLGKSVLTQPRLRSEQRVAALQVVAAAYFPNPADGEGVIQSDSALHYLQLAARLRPDVPLATDIRWPGLDSLFRVARERTFASIAIPPDESSLVGTEGRSYLEVISTRPAFVRVLTAPRDSSQFALHDSSGPTERARLGLRAHNGRDALLAVGEHIMLIEVADARSASRDTLRFRMEVQGDVTPMLARIPVFDSSTLLPDRQPRKLGKGIVGAIVFGGATLAMAQFARAREPIPSAFPTDGRSRMIAFLLAAGGVAGGLADKGVPLPGNSAANTILLAQHAAAVREAEDANRMAVSAYRLSIRISAEAP